MVYTTKTDPKGAKAGASFATSCIHYVGDAKDIQEAVTEAVKKAGTLLLCGIMERE